MAKKEYAVEGMTFKFENLSHSGDVSITGIASTKDKFDGKGVYKDNLNISISNGSNGSDISNATGSGTISATSQKNSSEGVKLLRDDESNDITMTGTNANPPPPTLTYTTKVIIDDPGQNVARGE